MRMPHYKTFCMAALLLASVFQTEATNTTDTDDRPCSSDGKDTASQLAEAYHGLSYANLIKLVKRLQIDVLQQEITIKQQEIRLSDVELKVTAKDECNGHQAQLHDLEMEMRDLRHQIDHYGNMTTNLPGDTSFMAYISDYASYSASQVIKFPDIYTASPSYDPITSKYTCEESGKYMFHVSLFFYNPSSANFGQAIIWKNGELVTRVYGDLRGGLKYATGSHTVIMECAEGDKVYVAAERTCNIHADRFSTFSGFKFSS